MGGKLYNQEEIDFILKNKDTMTYEEIGKILNRDAGAICRKISYLGFGRPKVINKYILFESYCELRIMNNNDELFISKIDKEDIPKLEKYTWNISNAGYLCARINNKNTLLHRYIFNEYNSEIFFDHINQDKFDNRKSNLRKCTKAENNQNKFDINKSSTGKRGVVLHKNGKMTAQVKINGVTIFLKRGTDLEELAQIASYARAYIHPFSKDSLNIKQSNIPQWIKDKIDKRLNNATK